MATVFSETLITLITGKEEDCLIFCFLQYVFQGASLYQRLTLCCRYSCVVSRVLVWVTICMKQVSSKCCKKNSLEPRARARFTVPSHDIVQLCTTPSDFEYSFGWLSSYTYCELRFTIFKVKPLKSFTPLVEAALIFH